MKVVNRNDSLCVPGRDGSDSLKISFLPCGKQLDVLTWARSVEEAACRAALLASGDVTVAGSVLAVAGAPVGGQSAADRARDLLPFTASREFAALRKQFGLSVK